MYSKMDRIRGTFHRKHLNQFAVLLFVLLWSHSVNVAFSEEFRDSSGSLGTVSDAQIPPDSRHVDLSYNRITRLFDGDFASLTQLQNLYLVHNQVNTIDNGAFRGLVSLQRLFLQNNKITAFPDLSELVELTEMYLQNNDISSLPDNVSIPSNNKVGRLDLSHNKFTSVPSNFLKNFKTLRYLNLCCGNLAAVPPVFELAGSLHILDLRSSKIPTLQSQSFSDGSTPSSLTELILEDNTLTVETDLFQSFPNLQILNINKVGLLQLPNLTMNTGNLQELHINNNSLSEINPTNLLGSPPDYSRMMALTTLSAAHNEIGSIDSGMLRSMNNLKNLNLGSNQLETFPLGSLTGSAALEYINLESNQIETLLDWGVTGRSNFKIDVTDNPLDCGTMCWFVRSGYASFNEDRLQRATTPQACAKPKEMTSYTWQEITTSSELLCSTEKPTTSTESSTAAGDKTEDGEDEGSSNKLQIIIGVAVAVFVVAGLLAVVSVLKFCVWGKKDPDVILIGKMETGLSQKRKKGSLGKKPNETELSEDKNSIKRENKDKRSSNKGEKHSRHSRSPRNSRLKTISEKSEDTENSSKRNDSPEGSNRGHSKDRRDSNSERNDKEKSRRIPERSNTFNRDPTISQEIPFEYTYRV